MNIQDRILEIIKIKGLNKNSFSSTTNIQPQTLHHIVSGRRTNPSFEVIHKIISTFSDINPRWFITGEGDMTLLPKEHATKMQEVLSPPGDERKMAALPNLTCELCKEKDRTITAMEKTVKAQEITIENLQEKIEELTHPQRGQKRKVG
jgi:Helix-turn-helix.